MHFKYFKHIYSECDEIQYKQQQIEDAIKKVQEYADQPHNPNRPVPQIQDVIDNIKCYEGNNADNFLCEEALNNFTSQNKNVTHYMDRHCKV